MVLLNDYWMIWKYCKIIALGWWTEDCWLKTEYRRQRKSEISLNDPLNEYTTINLWQTSSHDDYWRALREISWTKQNHCVDEDKIEFQWNNENNTQFRLNNTFRNCSIKENQLWWFVIFIEHVFETRENCLGPLLLVQVSFKGTLLCRGWGPPSGIYRRSIVCVLSSFYHKCLWKGGLSFW